MKEWAPLEVEYYKKRYQAASKGNYDIYVVFVEKGLSLLNKQGRLGFILPHKFFNAQYGQPLREIISQGQHLSQVVHFGDQQVFKRATNYTCLMFLNQTSTATIEYQRVNDLSVWRNTGETGRGTIPADSVTGSEWSFAIGDEATLLTKLRSMPMTLSDIAERIFQGIIPGADEVYAVDRVGASPERDLYYSRALRTEVPLEGELLRKLVSGAQVRRYTLAETPTRVIYPYAIEDGNAQLISTLRMQRDFPLTLKYLKANKDVLDARDRGSAKGSMWYQYIRRQNIALQPVRKLAVPRLVNRLHAAYDSEGAFCLDNVDVGGVILRTDDPAAYLYVLGLLNSRLLDFFFIRHTVPFRGGYFSNSADKARHDRMVSLVERMLALHKQAAEARTDQEKAVAQRQIELIDRQIDRLVYELYDLTDDEIAIVEGAR